VRDDKKQAEPYTYRDFLVNWDDLWSAVGAPSEELTEEEDLTRTQNLLDKASRITAIFGGVAQ
jgi:hypothetical protein